MRDGKLTKMILRKILLGHIFGEVYGLSQFKLSFGLMDNTDFMTGLFGKEELAKRVGACADFTPNSFNVFFLNSGMIESDNASGVGVAA